MSTDSGQRNDHWNPALYNENAAFVYSAANTTPIFALLTAKPGERILDLGCGSGELTLELQKVVGGAGTVVGMDSSQSMVAKALKNGCSKAFVGDAQALEFPEVLVEQGLHEEYDAVFSNAALHWCKRDPRGVIAGVKRVLKTDGTGRFVAEMGGYMNCVGVKAALYSVLAKRGYRPEDLDPWYFPSVEDYQKLLESEGFYVRNIGLTPRITDLPGELKDWLKTFVRTTWLEGMTDVEAEDIMSEVQKLYLVDGRDSSGKWALMYVRLRFDAILPA